MVIPWSKDVADRPTCMPWNTDNFYFYQIVHIVPLILGKINRISILDKISAARNAFHSSTKNFTFGYILQKALVACGVIMVFVCAQNGLELQGSIVVVSFPDGIDLLETFAGVPTIHNKCHERDIFVVSAGDNEVT